MENQLLNKSLQCTRSLREYLEHRQLPTANLLVWCETNVTPDLADMCLNGINTAAVAYRVSYYHGDLMYVRMDIEAKDAVSEIMVQLEQLYQANRSRHGALIDAAKAFLLVYFSDGKEKRPSDFDDDILGGIDAVSLFLGATRWSRTPFFEAMGVLIDEGTIVYRYDEQEGWFYKKVDPNAG